MNTEIDSQITREMYKKILDPKFDMQHFTYETQLGLVADCVESREIYQKILGKFVSNLEGKRGDRVIEKFSKDLEDMTGLKITVASLRVYVWVYQTLESILEKMPADYSYTTWRQLAGVDNPETWLDQAIQKGLSGPQLSRAIRLSKGKDGRKTVSCKKCGFEFKV